jgi:hypothetical protein
MMCNICIGLVLALAFLTGCGGKPASVSGLVTLDGKPVTRGTVAFSPTSGGQKAIGLIDESGRYELSTNREKGLDAGNYAVSVSSRERGNVGDGGGPPMPGKYLVPKKYSDANTSGLVFDVHSGGNKIDIAILSEGE